jgi:hypothetical protein
MKLSLILTYILSGLVLAITVLALLGIWEIIEWSYVQRYFWKAIQSLMIISVSSVVIYLIRLIFVRQENAS